MILRDRYWVFIPSFSFDGYKNDKKCCTSLYYASLRYGTPRSPLRLLYGRSLVFFSPDPRFRAGECVIVCLSFIYYEYAEPDSAVVNYSKDLTNYKGPNHGDF